MVYRYNGDGPIPGANKSTDKKKKDAGGSVFTKKSTGDWTCNASLVFDADHLVRVTYAANGVVSPYTERKDSKTGERTYVTPPKPCVFSLPNCARQ